MKDSYKNYKEARLELKKIASEDAEFPLTYTYSADTLRRVLVFLHELTTTTSLSRSDVLGLVSFAAGMFGDNARRNAIL